jgi:hypothetical protein
VQTAGSKVSYRRGLKRLTSEDGELGGRRHPGLSNSNRTSKGPTAFGEIPNLIAYLGCLFVLLPELSNWSPRKASFHSHCELNRNEGRCRSWSL